MRVAPVLKAIGCVVAALAITASLGAASASATSLCAVEAAECVSEDVYPIGTVVSATLAEGTASFVTNLGTLSCTKSSVSGVTGETADDPLEGSVTALAFEGCKFGGFINCTLEAKNLPYHAATTDTSAGDGVMTVTSGGSGSPAFKVLCGGLVNCTMTATEVGFAIDGGNPATVTPGALEFSAEGSPCPSEATWNAKYAIQQPKPLRVVDKITVTGLCKEKENPCKKAGNLHLKDTVMEAKNIGDITIKYEYKAKVETVKCTGSTVKLKTTAEKGAPLLGEVTDLTFADCSNKVCDVQAHHLPYNLEIEASAASVGNGSTRWLTGKGAKPPVFSVDCVQPCYYMSAELSMRGFGITGGAEATMGPFVALSLLKELEEGKQSDADCGAGTGFNAAFTWSGSYKVVSNPKNIWVVTA